MTRFRTYLSFILCALVLLIPCTANAVSYVDVGNIKYALDSTTHTAVVLDAQAAGEGTIVVPSTITVEMVEYTVTGIGANAFHGQEAVEVQADLQYIQAGAFQDVKQITLANCTALTIAQGAFAFTPDPEADEDTIYTTIVVPQGKTIAIDGDSELPAGILLQIAGTMTVAPDTVFVNGGTMRIEGTLTNQGILENRGAMEIVQILDDEDTIVSTGVVNNENRFVNAGTLENQGEWQGEDAVVPLSITSQGNGSVTVKAGDAVYTDEVPYGTQIVITAVNQVGYRIQKFTVNEEEKTSPYTVTATSELIIDAVFATCTTHQEEITAQTAATCTQAGSKTYTCKLCQTTRTETVTALEHDYAQTWTIDKSATCTTNGEKSHHCTRCDARTDITVIKAAHAYRRTLSKAATCTEPGLRKYTCSVCNHSYSVTIAALGHDYAEEWTIDVAPTCTTGGSQSHHCKNCDSQIDVTILEATGHDVTDWIIDAQATHEMAGSMHKECTICGEVVETVAIAKLQYTEEDLAIQGTDSAFEVGKEQVILAPTIEPSEPVEGDVRFVANTWTLGDQIGEVIDGTFALTPAEAGEQTLTVAFEKQVYTEGAWTAKGNASIQATLQVQESTAVIAPGLFGGQWWWWVLLGIVLLLLCILVVRKLAASSRKRKRIQRLREMK